MEKIFFLEPFVYKQIESDNFILYNTLTGKCRFAKSNDELQFLRDMGGNDYLVLKENLNPSIMKLINYLRDNFFGEIKETVNGKQFQQAPEIITNFREYEYIDKSISDYISELTIYINGECMLSCKKCDYAYKQIPFCTKNNNNELNYSVIEKYLSCLTPDYLTKIHINGGNILKHNNFSSIVLFLNQYGSRKYYYIHYQNIFTQEFEKLFLIEGNSSIIILFSDIPRIKDIEIVRDKMLKLHIPYRCIFVLQNQTEAECFEYLNLDEIEYDLYPIITKNNRTFFKKNVYLNKVEICSSPKLSYKELLEKERFNLHLWGKMFILNNGDFYANLNSEKLGNITDSSALGPIHKIVKEHKDVWYLTRKIVVPCNSCVYRILCPPISNYELYSGEYNMCNFKCKS